MHTTLVSAFGLASVFTATSARALVERQAGADCRNDPVRIALWENPPIRDDVNTFCNSLLGIPESTNCLSTKTPVVTSYGAVTATSTVTAVTTVPSSIVTVTVTNLNFALRKLAVRAAMTEAPYLNEARQAINNDFAKRQASGAQPDYTASLVSGCRCGPPTPISTNDICTGPASTKTIEGFNTTTSYRTVTSGVETVNVTVTSSTRINTSDLPTTSPFSRWEDWGNSTTSMPEASSTTSRASSATSATSSFEEPESNSTTTPEVSTTSQNVEPIFTSTRPGNATTTRSSVSSSADENISTTSSEEESSTASFSSSTSGVVNSSSTRDIPSGTSITTTTSSATSSSTPSTCPGKNGTVFSSNVKDCTQYEYICGRSYPPSSYYDLAVRRASPEDCTEICDAANAGQETPCVGIIWNTVSTGVNCRTLKNLDNPIDDEKVIALILRPDADCNVTTSSQSPMSMLTGTQSRSVTQPPWATGTGSRIWDHSWNGTWSYSYNRTRTWPTSYSKPTYTSSANVSTPVEPTLTSTASAMKMSSTSTSANVTSTPVSYSNTTTSYPGTASGNYSSTIAPNNTSTTSFTYSPSSGTGFPSSTLNSTTCPVSTITEKHTVYASVISYVTETQSASVSNSVETVTETRTASQSVETITETQTVSQTSVEIITETQTVSQTQSADTVTVTITNAITTAGRYGPGWSNWRGW